MKNTIYASFAHPDEAVKAAGALLDYGVLNEDLSVLGQGTEADMERYRMVHNNGPDAAKGADGAENTAKQGISTTTPADAAVGAAKGAGIGLGLGIAIALASITLPVFGLVWGGGALAAALAGAAATTGAGAVAGGVMGFLKDQGMPEDAATTYHEAITNGGAIIAVSLPSNNVDEAQARELLTKYGASNINSYEHPMGTPIAM